MPFNSRKTLETAIRSFVSQATGIPSKDVIPGNDPHPSPLGLYASVLKITTTGRGIDQETSYDDPDDETQVDLKTRGYRTGLYSVQIYRAGADDAAARLLMYPATSSGQEALQRLDLTFGRAFEVTLTDAVIATKWEERAAIRIEMKYRVEMETKSNALDSATPLDIAYE